MPRSKDDDRERPSWRDRDRKKDASSHIDQSDPYAKGRGRPGKAPAATSGYKAALDQMFEGGALPEKFRALTKKTDVVAADGGGAKRQKALRAVRDAVGGTDVAKATRVLIGIDGELPEDQEVLVAVLQHSDEEILRDVIQLLTGMHRACPLKRSDLLRQRVRKVESLAEEPETVSMAAELRKALK